MNKPPPSVISQPSEQLLPEEPAASAECYPFEEIPLEHQRALLAYIERCLRQIQQKRQAAEHLEEAA